MVAKTMNDASVFKLEGLEGALEAKENTDAKKVMRIFLREVCFSSRQEPSESSSLYKKRCLRFFIWYARCAAIFGRAAYLPLGFRGGRETFPNNNILSLTYGSIVALSLWLSFGCMAYTYVESVGLAMFDPSSTSQQKILETRLSSCAKAFFISISWITGIITVIPLATIGFLCNQDINIPPLEGKTVAWIAAALIMVFDSPLFTRSMYGMLVGLSKWIAQSREDKDFCKIQKVIVERLKKETESYIKQIPAQQIFSENNYFTNQRRQSAEMLARRTSYTAIEFNKGRPNNTHVDSQQNSEISALVPLPTASVSEKSDLTTMEEKEPLSPNFTQEDQEILHETLRVLIKKPENTDPDTRFSTSKKVVACFSFSYGILCGIANMLYLLSLTNFTVRNIGEESGMSETAATIMAKCFVGIYILASLYNNLETIPNGARNFALILHGLSTGTYSRTVGDKFSPLTACIAKIAAWIFIILPSYIPGILFVEDMKIENKVVELLFKLTLPPACVFFVSDSVTNICERALQARARKTAQGEKVLQEVETRNRLIAVIGSCGTPFIKAFVDHLPEDIRNKIKEEALQKNTEHTDDSEEPTTQRDTI